MWKLWTSDVLYNTNQPIKIKAEAFLQSRGWRKVGDFWEFERNGMKVRGLLVDLPDERGFSSIPSNITK